MDLYDRHTKNTSRNPKSLLLRVVSTGDAWWFSVVSGLVVDLDGCARALEVLPPEHLHLTSSLLVSGDRTSSMEAQRSWKESSKRQAGKGARVLSPGPETIRWIFPCPSVDTAVSEPPPCFQLRGRDPHPPARGLDTQLIQPWLIPGHTDSAKAPVCPARPPICHLLLPDRSEASLALVESLRAVICILGHRPRQSRLNTHHGFRSHQVPRLGSRPSGWATSGGLECSVDPHCPLPPSPGFFYTPGVWAGFKSEQAVSRENCRGHPAVLSCLIFVSSCRQPTAGFPRVSASELQIFKDALRTICIHVFLSFCQFQDFLNIS